MYWLEIIIYYVYKIGFIICFFKKMVLILLKKTPTKYLLFRSKVKSGKIQNDTNNRIDDLFGTVSFSKDYPTKYPTTVPIAKNHIRNSLGHLFDGDLDGKPSHSSANVPSTRKQSQQVFPSNQRYTNYFLKT